MFQAETLVGARMSANTAVAAAGILLDPDGMINASETPSTSFGAAEPSDALGVVGTAQRFVAVVVGVSPDGHVPRIAPRVLVRIPWTVTTKSTGGAGTRATIHADLMVNGVSLVSANGKPRDVGTGITNGDEYVDLIELVVPVASNQAWAPGTLVSVQVQPQVTTVSGVPGSTMELTLRHNPQEIDDQLVAEFTGFKDVL